MSTQVEKTAKEMFEAFGFRQNGQDDEIYSKNNICYINGNAKIEFNKKEKSYIAWEYKKILLAYEISLDIHLAIHQQMKELGWIK